MAGSITVIGGANGDTLTGLVSIADSGIIGSIATSLQTLLNTDHHGGQGSSTGLSDSVLGGTEFLNNVNVLTLNGGIGSGNPSLPGLLELTNTDSTGGVTAGNALVSLTVPSNYSTLLVQAPGTESITGNGSNNFLAVFGSESTVNFYTGGGSGTVVAGANGDQAVLVGNSWTFYGSTEGGDTVAALSANTAITVSGAGDDTNGVFGPQSNVVSTDADNVSVSASGPNDLVVVYGGTSFVTMHGGGNVLMNGGVATVTAAAGSESVAAFFDVNGGTMDFINNSGVAASVFGSAVGAVGGNLTVFGGSGGGYYQGGLGGNNSLIGGSGSVTLIGNGDGNYLSGAGADNAMFAGGGATTMVGAAGSGTNIFNASTGTASAISFGSGGQAFFAGTSGQDNFTGSTVSGAVNRYYFLQDDSGAGSDIINNFKLGRDQILINPYGADSASGVVISSIDSIGSSQLHPTGGSLVLLSDSTTITLYGVNASSINSFVGKTFIA